MKRIHAFESIYFSIYQPMSIRHIAIPRSTTLQVLTFSIGVAAESTSASLCQLIQGDTSRPRVQHVHILSEKLLLANFSGGDS
ncbi:uncharacterized protein PHALS_15100 [Plasmopara halstedii]|uniref:Uncharacterized protein n=1 Tax=Plasmopara halstedii TaxID=4781 RepID=A0A0N7L7V0_PLAHL|nr:uncharacterized protein PHALS_15100 [Plasmopara halstedii]CEG48091.1 hypothetical protein PHALS_15100 [Plasmopara halstedii]|eukprot:XP_024584460.1 hypothetical protein PHALS_15100 [Plasmopara halstedii]